MHTPQTDTPQSLDGYTWPTCAACHGNLRQDEAGRVACRPCQWRTDEHLAALPGARGLYAQLADALTPGSGAGDGRVTGATREAPLPLRLEPLSLGARGGVVTILQTWLVDWHEQLGWRHPRWNGNLQQQCDQAVCALRVNLDWAATSHPAFAEFTAEIAQLVRDCSRQTTGERPERRVAVACGCGAVLRITLSTPGARCHCGIQYARADLFELPLADRTAAA